MTEGGATTDVDEVALLGRLRDGDEAAFRTLVKTHHAMMTRVARLFVASVAEAEEVAQDAWVGVLRGLDGFEGRSSLRTWIFRILVNRAKSRGVRERRTVPFSAIGSAEDAARSVDPERFRPDGNPWAGHWTVHPGRWSQLPEELLVAQETLQRVEQAIDGLAPSQAAVMRLRDIDGWTAAEVCEALEMPAGNQRVLLHRARSHVRAAIERYLQEVTS